VKVVLDTNVIVSGLFFGGIPGQILSAWNAGQFTLVLSASILAEYREVGAELSSRNDGLDFESFAAVLLLNSEVVDAPEHLDPQVCDDSEDDKFLACANAASAEIVVSGDRQLLATTGWNGIQVLKPREFSDRYLRTTD
jgi:uncharacterized protein